MPTHHCYIPKASVSVHQYHQAIGITPPSSVSTQWLHGEKGCKVVQHYLCLQPQCTHTSYAQPLGPMKKFYFNPLTGLLCPAVSASSNHYMSLVYLCKYLSLPKPHVSCFSCNLIVLMGLKKIFNLYFVQFFFCVCMVSVGHFQLSYTSQMKLEVLYSVYHFKLAFLNVKHNGMFPVKYLEMSLGFFK